MGLSFSGEENDVVEGINFMDSVLLSPFCLLVLVSGKDSSVGRLLLERLCFVTGLGEDSKELLGIVGIDVSEKVDSEDEIQ